jgi:hypothetical protein
MKPYRNASGGSGVSAYDYGNDWILIKYVNRRRPYEYTLKNVGKANLAAMKRLADTGQGLTTFINTHPSVKNGYTKAS